MGSTPGVPVRQRGGGRGVQLAASGCGIGCLALVGLWLAVALGVFGYGQYQDHQRKQWAARLQARFAPLVGEWTAVSGDAVGSLGEDQKKFRLQLADNSSNTHIEGEPPQVLEASSHDRFLVITFKDETASGSITGIAVYPDRMMGVGGFANAEATIAGNDELQIRLVDRDSQARSGIILRRAGR